MKVLKQLIACLIALPLLVIPTVLFTLLPPGFQNPSLDLFRASRIIAKYGSEEEIPRDKLLGGLLAVDHNEESCLSRYQSSLYRKASPYVPSSYLVSRLRNYENLHKNCGPGSQNYIKISDNLKLGKNLTSTECKYLVVLTRDGLGNRMLTVTSAFLYALLTNHVLLVDQGNGLDDLFCEPFPERSWFLPRDFPLKDRFHLFKPWFPQSFGNMRKSNMSVISPGSNTSQYLYLNLAHDAGNYDNLFFCDQDQAILNNIPFLIMQTNNYFIPGLFLMPSFKDELTKLFPRKDTAFHHLGRYLFHPTNEVWGLVTRSYEAYLSQADEKIGIQIRIYKSEANQSEKHMDQILNCVHKENLLPEVINSENENIMNNTISTNRKVKTVLITSLYSQYQENLKSIYLERPTRNGDIIRVFQPSHEEVQKSNKWMHNRKAWAEVYLLSLCDVLVTSAWSTFGYVAQGLAGVEPWILYKPESLKEGLIQNKKESSTGHSLACERAVSMEPCFHAPPVCDCSAVTRFDAGKVVPYVRHCEDWSLGIKLIDSD